MERLGGRIRDVPAGDTRAFADADARALAAETGTVILDVKRCDQTAWYDVGMANGALGGKLIGAGRGGFLLFYAKGQKALRDPMARKGSRRCASA